ncbi:hypothetical protein MSAN_01182800 [Mycena sanguinolenta]|uniref:Uncharacterized protein n=1 Tax=Mycena sanguinolenta TaxID=230812 RepID=A0A8H7D445_9AGAR|nr:hypothetical protein MSAN_01182800 [Mycena sanguinolenta]
MSAILGLTLHYPPPALWASIQIALPCAERNWKRIMPTWVQRSHNLSLSISLSGNLRYLTHGISSRVWQHADRLKHLEISDDSSEGDEDEDHFDDRPSVVRLFSDMTPPSFRLPMLQALTVRSLSSNRGFGNEQILELLGLAPSIIQCTIDCRDLELDDVQMLVLPTLRQLILGDNGDDGILNCLSLPALQNLSLANDGCLIQRSSSLLGAISSSTQRTGHEFQIHDRGFRPAT